MNFEVVIGLEIHVQVKSKTKMFSSAENSFSLEPNVHIAPLDMAFPGSMPLINKQVIRKAIQLAHVLNMKIDHELWFDRKNYFYSDLPKGYQITQHFRPLGMNGYLEINDTKYAIKEMHIEEDSAKQIHKNNKTYIDFNRVGIPLLEIVSEPIFHSGQQARLFMENITELLHRLDISEARLEKGSLRCDVNISLKPYMSNLLGKKVEIKNLNSFMNIEKAIDREIDRQSSLLYQGKEIKQETYRFDEKEQTNVLMREKENNIDYRYFVESNIPPITLTTDFINSSIKETSSLFDKEKELMSLGLNKEEVTFLMKDEDLCNFFLTIIKEDTNPKVVYKWLKDDISELNNKGELSIKELDKKRIVDFFLLIEKEEMSHQIAKEILLDIVKTNNDVKTIYKQKCLILINNKEQILAMIKEVVDKNPQAVIDYQNGKERIVNYLLGKINEMSKGKIDQSLTYNLIVQELQRR